MSDIEWTDETWNPTVGCSRVSAGCEHCYAEGVAHRGMSPQHRGLTVLSKKGPRWNGTVRLVHSALTKPLSWTKPRRIFVNSMSDLFHEALTNEEIATVFGIMAACGQHTFQVLTKRPDRAAAWFTWLATRAPLALRHYIDVEMAEPRAARQASGHDEPEPPTPELRALFDIAGPVVDALLKHRLTYVKHLPQTHWRPWPLQNVWLGVSVENQATANERIPTLLGLPTAIRFVSYEPALGPVSFRDIIGPGCIGRNALRVDDGTFTFTKTRERHLDWVIVGGESGPGARPFDLAWARSAVEQCRTAGVACFVKQLGACAIDEANGIAGAGLKVASDVHVTRRLKHRKGADMSEWPEDLRVREFPRSAA